MAIARVQTVRTGSGSGDAGTNGASSVTKSVTVTAGNTLLVFVGYGTAQTVTSVTGGSNTYVAQNTMTHTNYGMKCSSFVATNTTGGTFTITANFSAGTAFPWLMMVEFSGAAGADGGNTGYQPTASPTSTDGITTATATNSTQPAMMFGLIIGAGSSSPGTGFTFDTFGSDFGISGSSYSGGWATEFKTLSTTTAVAATWTNGNSADNVGTIMQIIDQAAAGGGALVRGPLINPGRLVGVLAR